MSQRSAPDPYYSPPSPTYTRQAPPYASQGPAVVQTARTRRSSSVSRPRPQSFAGDASAGYWASMGMGASAYPSPPQERGPPPSFSAYQNRPMPNMQYGVQPMPPYMGGAPAGDFYGHPSQPYPAQQRPPPSARTASNFSQRGHAPPIITQEDPGLSKYSARYNHSQPPTPSEHHTRNPSLQQRKPLQLQYPVAGQDEASESEYTESEEEYDERRMSRRVLEAQAARELMPPPKIKRDPSQRRPPLAHAKTSQVVDRLDRREREGRRQSIVIPDRSIQPERERERVRANVPPARRASVSRPPPPHRQTQSEYNTRQARVVVNDNRHNRRQSAYQSYEKAYDDYVRAQAVDDQYNAERKREKRASRIVQEQQRYVPGQFNDSDDDEEEEEVRVRALSRPRRKTESDSRKGKERTSEIKQKANDAEEYIKSTRGSREAYADHVNKAALKKVSRVSQPSDSGSSNSNGSGNRTTMTSTTNNEIRLRVDGTMPLSLQLSGDMEGRTLQLVPAENGMTDLVIGGNTRSGETVYRSERGSTSGNKTVNRRSIVAGQGRRDAEDLSERSSRGTRSRRDRDEIREVRDERGHVLRRSRTTAYH
ncbi:hypothetical protein IQ06DRAFT_223759 [Phaeosphaeriaceae sp. SRC1lsM3a]|nr:hypothetical protein IQ06DRAFT_223759 [Stagonospora sp. SRC1lsM3a]